MSAVPSPVEQSALADDVRPREVWAWAMYDFANSGYTTVVITAIFNVYFIKVIAGGAPWATLAWSSILAVSYVLILVTAPVLGAIADARAAKKRVLALSTSGCIIATALLAGAGPGDLLLAALLLIASNFFFGTGENVIAAFLPELGRGAGLGRVSAWGWSLGYLGGLATLGACLAYVAHAQAQGGAASEFVPVTLLITAGIFAVASLPTFLVLRERAKPQPRPPGAIVTQAYARLGKTWREANRFTDLARFLVCLTFYQAGVQTVVALAAVYAEEAMGFSTRDTITLILTVNIAAAAGAFGFGYVQDRIGHRAAVAWTIVGWIVTVAIAWLARAPATFWIAATLAGLCLGSSQSSGRALVGYLSPEDRRGEFFGLWGVAMKLASIVGPVTYGATVWLAAGDHRTAILGTAIFFVVGLVLLARVDVERGRDAALQAATAGGRDRGRG